MKLSTDWHDFRAKFDKLYSRYGKPTQLSLGFADDDSADTGKGLVKNGIFAERPAG